MSFLPDRKELILPISIFVMIVFGAGILIGIFIFI